MNQDFARNITPKRIAWIAITLLIIGTLVYAFTHGSVTINVPAGYKMTYYDLSQSISKPQPFSDGFHILGTGKYQISFTKGPKQYNKTITVSRFLQHQTVSLQETGTKSIEHISAGTRHYTYPLGNELLSYDKLGEYVLRQQYNDPLGTKNHVVDYMEGDGECRVIGIIQSSPWCLSKGIDSSNELAIYPISITLGQPDGTRRMEMGGSIFALDNGRLVVIKKLEASVYTNPQSAAQVVTLKKSVARNGDSAIISVTDKFLLTLSGDNFEDGVGDSPQSATTRKSYELQRYEFGTKNSHSIAVRDIAPVQKVSLSPDGKYTALHTIAGITIIDNNSGERIFTITNDDVNDGVWHNESYLFQDVNGIYVCDTSKQSSYPLVAHDRISISSFNIINNTLYFTGYYRSQTGQDPQGFRIDLKSTQEDTNEIYNFLPTEQSNFAVYIDQRTLYVLNREVVGKVGTQQQTNSSAAMKFIEEKLPQRYKSYQVVKLN